MNENNYSDQDVVLRHTLPVRLFHWSLVLGFLPAGATGILLFLRPFNADIMHMMMQIHILGAVLLTLGCAFFLLLQPTRVAVFMREIFTWEKKDIEWLKVSGGYPQKIFFGKEIPVPPMGKINSGQKMMGLGVFFGGIIIIFTGWILYLALPVVPKTIAFYTDKIHLIIGVLTFLAIVFGHIPLGVYNWKEFISMFVTGTMKVKDAIYHHPLWVQHEIEKTK